MHLVILSGGVGSRLWPASRKLHPKPFIKMPNGLSILQNTLLRAIYLRPKGIINVTNGEFLFKINKEWSELPSTSRQAIKPWYILEPFGKNTAAAIAMSCLWVANKIGKNETLLILPSDHLIANQEAFSDAVNQANKLASEQDKIVTFGIVPNAPETGYGYIEFENNSAVKKFIEKPSSEKAKEYLESGKYLWNSGMFCFKAGVMLEEMAKHCPDILSASQICFDASITDNDNIFSIDAKSFQNVRDNSIDYAVMEKSNKVSVVPCDIGWSDIGNWNAISQTIKSDDNGNTINATTVIDKVSNCYIEGTKRLIAAIGVDNLVIVDTPDALLIANKNNTQDVKNIYNNLASSKHQTHETHLTVHRPWGSYTILEEQDNFKIKRIEVNPGASLSLQSHQHRSEHWVVVTGQAKVINDNQELLLNISQSTYIPAGCKHRLSNVSDSENLVIIEVQTGSYLGEDDIQRFEDIYRRGCVR